MKLQCDIIGISLPVHSFAVAFKVLHTKGWARLSSNGFKVKSVLAASAWLPRLLFAYSELISRFGAVPNFSFFYLRCSDVHFRLKDGVVANFTET
ncbi:hypothetical protein Nepgr_012244 [Nepenthes gracilis]|uniref:Uncharacterized protein n=1 Tax=Nepenthes gracilis TaxID=150966 RepID=A0AAD3SFN9_NEPGR|nr:hypothetical protein Nepgr_012244 [Nepenthes gracilis]